jgi:cytochrome c-type biogenesis protein CcmF
LISEAVQGVKVTVSAPFFEQVNGPIFLLLILLMGVCPLIGWRRASRGNLMRNFLYPLVTALGVTVLLIVLGVMEPFALLSFALCAFVIATILLEWFRGVRGRHRTRGENYFSAFFHLIGANRPRYGGYIVHLAIVLIAIGVTGSTFYRVEKEVSLAPGGSTSINGYTLEYQGMTEYATGDRQVTAATLKVYNSGELVDTMVTEKYFHRTHQQPVTEVAIKTTLREDLYVILADWTEDGVTTFKMLISPLVVWIWIGGVVLILGSVIAFWPERRAVTANGEVEEGR